ncbi:hypothetical protein [Bacillus badius]|uniref:hypothetical protein n=1 Tax=Bacillus badius TaxID=1455 RepID=UPI0005978D3D|nr:hypothetical protein [Bacillus badius]MED4718402.1 hypothetical protein [Bacillus badius]
MNNLKWRLPGKPIAIQKGQKDKDPVVFDSELHFTVEGFCKETGYTESFVSEAMEHSDEFIGFVLDGIGVIPRNAKQHNVDILRRAKYRELS